MYGCVVGMVCMVVSANSSCDMLSKLTIILIIFLPFLLQINKMSLRLALVVGTS